MGNTNTSKGYLVEKWVYGRAAQMGGCLFGFSDLPMAPFIFENWFRYTQGNYATVGSAIVAIAIAGRGG